MRVVFTGQTGLDKKTYLQDLSSLCASKRVEIDAVFHVGDMMYEIAQGTGKRLPEGKILDLPLSELRLLRRVAFTNINYQSATQSNVLVNSHATFRWNSQLFVAFDLPEVEGFRPDMVVTLVDDVDAVKLRLDKLKSEGRLPSDVNYALKDIMVWREEEILASEILASLVKVPHYVLGVWMDPLVTSNPKKGAFALLFEPWKRRAYVSYPISTVLDKPQIWGKVIEFRKLAWRYLAAFDPLSITERRLQAALRHQQEGDRTATALEIDVRGMKIELEVSELQAIVPDINGQIVARDYKFIDQADIIVAYFPVGDDGRPVIAGGVQSEIEHAAGSGKNVIIVWESEDEPTPFIGLKIDMKFANLQALEGYLAEICKPTGQMEMPLES